MSMMDRKTLHAVLADPISRRRFLGGAGMLAGLVIAREMPALAQDAPLNTDPFTLGVASGDPLPDGVVLWTRLAPDPLNGGLKTDKAVVVRWEVATDEKMGSVVQKGETVAVPQFAHSVHVELTGLQAGRHYWYRFHARTYSSPIGRTKTAPPVGAPLSRLRFAFVSCNDWQNGHFAAYRHLATEDLDFLLHLGDYIYEYGPKPPLFDEKRVHTTPEAGPMASQLTTLADYRNRHAQYKTDTALCAAHAAHPFITVWDDHEAENNYANDVDEEPGTTPADFLLQRAAAYQAYYEHMPVRRTSLPTGPDMRLYRNLTFGDLAEVRILDTRQYRTAPPKRGGAFAGMGFSATLPTDGNPSGYLLGETQEKWLLDGLGASRTKWNIVAQQIMVARMNFFPKSIGGPDVYNLDQWDGYGAARQRLLDFFAKDPAKNYVVLTGDIHSAWVHDLKKDFADPASPTVATELVGTSVTSEFPTAFVQPVTAASKATPWTKFFDGARRGYTVCTLTPTEWRADFKFVTSNARGQVESPEAAIAETKSFVITAGTPGAKAA
jgi:alkaline phosphatase D